MIPNPSRARLDVAPTAAGGIVVLTAVVAVGLAGLSANPWLLLVTGALAGLLLTTGTRRTDLAGVEVECSGVPRATSGGEVFQHVTLTNRGERALPSFRLAMSYPGLADLEVRVPALAPGGQACADLVRTAGRRGGYRGGALLAVVTDPLGLVRRRYAFTVQLALTVHPRPGQPLTAQLSWAGQDSQDLARRGSDELAGLRPWRPGDERRDVHWRSSARRGRLVVVERDEPTGEQWVLAVVGAFRAEADELALSRLASTWVAARASELPVRLLTWPSHLTPAGASVEQVLDWCATVDSLEVPEPSALLQALPEGCSAVTVLATSTTPPGWLPELITAGHARGVRVVAVDGPS
jgi:uncharacterized protein (DUF58 family)